MCLFFYSCINWPASILGMLLGGLMYPHVKGWLFVLSAVLIFAVVVLSARFPREIQDLEPVLKHLPPSADR